MLLKHIIEEKIEGSIEVTGGRRRRRRPLLNALKKTRGYWNLKEEVLARCVENSLWKRLVVRQIME
jgi:hypothetical protein